MTIKDIQTIIGTTPDGIWGNQSIRALRVALSKGVVIPITKNVTLNELLVYQAALLSLTGKSLSEIAAEIKATFKSIFR